MMYPTDQPPWMPPGYHEEEREWYPLLLWFGTHMWGVMRLIGRLNPHWSQYLAVAVLAHWPRFRYHVLVRDHD